MENSNQYCQTNYILENQSKEKLLLLNKKIISDESTTVNNKEEMKNTLPLLENMIKSNNNNQRSQSEKPRKNSVTKIKRIKEDENNKNNSIINPERKHIKRNERKNQTINMVRKPRKNNELGGTIKVVGKISSKLESVIHKLEQNFINENISNTRIENKYVMGPKIKEALEKINKKIEEDKNIQKISFTERKYKEIIVSDSDRDKKTQSMREKTKYIQEINKDKYEDKFEEEEGEDDSNESFNIDDNKEKNNSKTKYKNKKKRKKNSIKVLNLSGESSSDIEDENDTKNKENNKINKKRKRKKDGNLNISNNEISEENKEEKRRTNKPNINKKRISIKKKKSLDLSEEKSEKSEEKMIDSDEEEEGSRKLIKHKSGRCEIFISSKNISRSASASLYSSDQSNHSLEKNKDTSVNSKNNQITKDNPININKSNNYKSDDKNNEFIDGPVFKIIEYDKFTYKQYIVKNYHPKPVTIWKKQIKKYIPSKQTDFSLFSTIEKNFRYKKDLILNLNQSNNDLNKKRRTIKKVRKSECPNINDNFLFTSSKKFDIDKFEETISNFEKKKNSQIYIKTNIDKDIEVPRKRFQSIFVKNNISINEFDKNNKKEKTIQKHNAKRNKMGDYGILLKKGFNGDSLENKKTESNDKKNKKVKFNGKNIENHHSNKNKENNLNNVPEERKGKENDIIKETHFGVKYIMFQNNNEPKTISIKNKWNLSISNVASIFLKAVIPQKDKNISNSKVNSNINKNVKINFDKNNQIKKTSFNYISNGRKTNDKNNDVSNKLNESNSSSSSNDSSSKNILQNKLINETINKDHDSNKEKDNIKKQICPTNNLYFNYISNINYNKETKKDENNLLVKSNNIDSNISESPYKKNDINYSNELKNNNSLKNTLTIKVRKMNRKYEFTSEKNDKKKSKVKSKKARIKNFKSLKNDSEFNDNKRKRKGNLYDGYTSKKQIERKKFVKEDCYKQNTLNTKANIKNSRYGYNSNKNFINLKKCCSGRNVRNNSNNKKNNVQVNPITFLETNNNKQSSLIMNYRQQIIEGMSNQYTTTKISDNKKIPKNVENKSMSALRRKNYIKFKLNPSKEMSKIEAIKSKMKKKLIELNDKLIDAINYYNGPIDISCISSKKYSQTVEDLTKWALKNGYHCTKLETNYYKLSNSNNTFFVEIVKIRNNLLYYLIVKNK